MTKYLESDDGIEKIFELHCETSWCGGCVFTNVGRYSNFKCNPDDSANWAKYLSHVKRDLEILGLITVDMGKPEQDIQRDMVHQPSHYTDGGIETIDYIRSKLTQEQFQGYCIGNIIKYVSRAGKKEDVNPIMDYRKASVYLNWLIEEMELGHE